MVTIFVTVAGCGVHLRIRVHGQNLVALSLRIRPGDVHHHVVLFKTSLGVQEGRSAPDFPEVQHLGHAGFCASTVRRL